MMRKYRVSGGRKVSGHQPGEEFERDYRPDHEARLLKNGFIERVEDEEPEPEELEAQASEDENEWVSTEETPSEEDDSL